MGFLPAPRGVDPGRPSRDLIRAADARQRTELEVFRYGLQARARAEMDRIDTQALSDVLRCSLDEEVALLDWGIAQANGSAAKAELVARKVAMQSGINNSRIARRFGN